MHGNLTRRPSPALVLAVMALVAAFAGTAIASDPVATTAAKKLTKKKVKKIAAKQIAAAAPGLSVSHADTAGTADAADSAANADTLDGLNSSDFLRTCPAGTIAYAGVCFEQSARADASWFSASKTCGDTGGRLPTSSELEGFRQVPGGDLGIVGEWSSTLGVDGALYAFATDDSGAIGVVNPNSARAFRCVLPHG